MNYSAAAKLLISVDECNAAVAKRRCTTIMKLCMSQMTPVAPKYTQHLYLAQHAWLLNYTRHLCSSSPIRKSFAHTRHNYEYEKHVRWGCQAMFCGCRDYITAKTLITNKCTERVLSPILTHSYMFRPCWVIFRENFFVIVTLRLHLIFEWECAVDCVLEAWTLCGPGLRTPPKTTQYTVNSTFSLNYKVQP
jgi:hypothetical protein